MILLDAVYINKGGGKILLDLLVTKIINDDVSVFFLLDKRLENNYPEVKKNIYYLEPSFRKRHQFYKQNKYRFTSVLAFGNIPPTIKMDCKVYTFFQNVLFLNVKFGFDYYNASIYLKAKTLKFLRRNTDSYIVQNQLVKDLLRADYKLGDESVYVLPIYNDALKQKNFDNTPDYDAIRFLYVSTGEIHKNHARLMSAFARFNKLYPASSLTITVGSEYKKLIEEVTKFQAEGVNIINKGFLDRSELEAEYLSADVFVFPSLFESFGLGLVEATMYNLPIIAPDRQYVKEIILPSEVFNPEDIDSIFLAMLNFPNYIHNTSRIKIRSRIDDLFKLLLGK